MKKIFSFIAAMLCAAGLMAAEPAGGPLIIPDLVAAGVSASINSVTRNGVELQPGDSVFEGETLTISYSAQLPWFFLNSDDSVRTVTLAVDMFSGSSPYIAYMVPVPNMDRYYIVTLPDPEHATVSATLNGTDFTGGYALLGDTLVINYVSNDPIHWFFDANDATSWSDTAVLESSFFTDYAWTIYDPNMYKKDDYYLYYKSDDFVRYVVMLNGDTLPEIESDSVKGHVVHEGDILSACAYAAPGLRLSYGDTAYTCMQSSIVPYMFNSDSILILSLDAYVKDPVITDIEVVDSTKALISWIGDCDNYEIRVATETPNTPDVSSWKGVRSVTGQEYLAEGLVPGAQYYVLLRAVFNDSIHSGWEYRDFVFGGNNCMLRVEMEDSYGDGWNGNALVFTENGKSDTITLKDGIAGRDYYYPNGSNVSVSWEKGSYSEEVSFTIYDGFDNILLQVHGDEASKYSNGQLLYDAAPCLGVKQAQITEITCSVDETGTYYTFNWKANDAESYEIVVTQDTAITEEQLAAQAVSRKTRVYIYESAKPYAFYYVYVRGINKNGETGRWRKKLVYGAMDFTNVKSNLPEALALVQPIQLDYNKQGLLLTDAMACNQKIRDYAMLAYMFTMSDTALFSLAFQVESDMPMFGPSVPAEMMCLKVENGKKGVSVNEVFGTDESYFSDSLPSGQYVLLIATSCENLGRYSIDIRLNNAPTQEDSLVYTNFQLDYADTTDFVNAQLVRGPFAGGMPTSAKLYQFTPTDTVTAQLSVQTSSQNIIMYVAQMSKKPKMMGSGLTCFGRFIKDSTYMVVIFNDEFHGGKREDSFTFTAKQIKNDSISIIPISTDTVVTVTLSYNQYQEKDNAYEQIYAFEVTEPTKMHVFINELVANPSIGLYPGPGPVPPYVVVCRDSLNGLIVHRAEIDEDQYSWFECAPDSVGDTARYYVAVCSETIGEYLLKVRSEIDYNNIGGPLVQVGQKFCGRFDMQDRPVQYNLPGVGEGVRVPLEKGKNYAAVLFVENPNGGGRGLSLSVMKPGVKDTLYDNNVLFYDTDYRDDERRAVAFQADTTAEFSFLLDVMTENYKRFDSIPFEFMVVEYLDFVDYIAQLDTVEAPFFENGKMLNTDVKVKYETAADFHHPVSYVTDVAGVWSTVGRAVNVPAGDTLFVEFDGDADPMIHVLNPDSNFTDWYALASNNYLEFEPEQLYVVNDDTIAHTYFVLGSFFEFDQAEHNYTLRFGIGEKSMESKKATAKLNASSVTVKRSASVPDIQAELLKLTIEAYNEQNQLIGTIGNSLDWWTIDEVNNEAVFETSSADLPIGYEYANGREYLKVTINRKKPATVTAKASADTISVAAEATEADIRAELANLTIKVYTGNGKVVMTVTNNAQLWNIDEDEKIATYEVKNAELPNLDDYSFSNGSGLITIVINRLNNQGIDEVIANSDSTEKVLIDGQIYIIRDKKVYTIMGQQVR